MAEKETKNDDKHEDEPIAVVTDEDLLKRSASPEDSDSDDDGDDHDGQGDDDGDDEREEQRLGESEEREAEAEQKKARAEERKSRRQRQKAARDRLERELKFLEKRNDHLERELSKLTARVDSTEGANTESRISQLKAAIKKAEQVHSEAVSAHKGEEATEALAIRDNLRDQLSVLEESKKAREERGSEPPQLPPQVIANIQKWHKKNSWYDFRRGDYDSRVAGAIDDSLVAEGFDPSTQEYWDELNERIADALPHRAGRQRRTSTNGRANGGDVDEGGGKPPRGGPRFRKPGGSRNLRQGEFYLSGERIQALKDAGVWDDPKQRDKYIRRYKKYDEEHGLDTDYSTR